MNFKTYNIPRQPRSKKHLAATATARTVLVTAASGGVGSSTTTEASKITIVEVGELDYPIFKTDDDDG